MLAIVPVILDAASAFWGSPEGIGLVENTIRALESIEAVREVRVFARPPLPPVSVGAKTRVHCLARDPAPSRLFPAGAAEACLALANEPGLRDEHVLVVNYRNPLLGREILAEAVARFLAGAPSPLVSVVKPRDHPCQMRKVYRIEDVRLLYLVDDAFAIPGAPGMVAAKPIPFAWRERVPGDGAAGSWYVPAAGDAGSGLDLAAPGTALGDGLAYRRESDDLARVTVPRAWAGSGEWSPGQVLAGFSLADDGGGIGLSVITDRDGNGYVRGLGRHPAGERTIRLFALRGGRFDFHNGFEYDAADTDRPFFNAAMLQDAEAYLACVMRVPDDGEFDLSETAPLHEEFLRTHSLPATMRALRLSGMARAAGEARFANRQELPCVFMPDGSFFLAALPDAGCPERLLAEGQARAFELSGDYALAIRGAIDVCRYKARLMASREREASRSASVLAFPAEI